MRTEDRSGGSAQVAVFAVLHLLCCGVPLLMLSGVSLGVVLPRWPTVAVALAAVGVIGFVWYLKRGCATCPRNEGCRTSQRCPTPGELPQDQRHV